MKLGLQIISMLALLMTVVPSIMFLTGSVELGQVKCLMLGATIVWFAATPFWMGKKEEEKA